MVTASTFIVQLVGPPCVKLAVHKAGEAGVNITIGDLIASYKVQDVMGKTLVVLEEFTSLAKVLETFSEHDALCYPVVSQEREFVGIVAFQNIKDTLDKIDLQHLLVAHDIMEQLDESAQLSDPHSD